MPTCEGKLRTIDRRNKNRLEHENINSTMFYLHLDLTRKLSVQKKFVQYVQFD